MKTKNSKLMNGDVYFWRYNDKWLTAEEMTDATLAVYQQALAHAAGSRRDRGDP